MCHPVYVCSKAALRLRVIESTLVCITRKIEKYSRQDRVTQGVPNLPLSSKQKFCFGLAWPGLTRPKQKLCFEVNGRFGTT